MDSPEPETPFAAVSAHTSRIGRQYQAYLDKCTPYTLYRWLATGAFLVLFFLRVIIAQGWYVVAYALSIFLLNQFLLFLQPKFDPSLSVSTDPSLEEGTAGETSEPVLPTKQDEEFRPFIRRLPEFKFWYTATRGIALSIVATMFDFLDLPVFWPVLVVYFIVLFMLTMRRQIQHMIKYRYVPFTFGKTRYEGRTEH
ncbi:MAG: hypothetical protein M1834_006643 [Cirrosporium novae-zelandiae]|nr:MAG: hypothetical protein M1834_006643 [Cirrosporium novae-zelandiae]